MATTLPTVIVTAARPQNSTVQSDWITRKDVTSTRISAANAAALDPVAMKAVTLVGAPAYTSGAHMWNGTDAILKPKPTRRRANPIRRSASGEVARARRSRSVVPVDP
jgi:hypothetical protein